MQSTSASAIPTISEARAEVARVVDAFHAAWNAHDMARFGRLFAGDADYVNVIGLHWRGRDEIEREHVALHESRMKGSELRRAALSVRFLRPDVALVHDTWELEGDTGLDGEPQPARQGVLSLVIVREDGRWVIASGQNTDIVPIPNVPTAR